jgi:hypothetical protein
MEWAVPSGRATSTLWLQLVSNSAYVTPYGIGGLALMPCIASAQICASVNVETGVVGDEL